MDITKIVFLSWETTDGEKEPHDFGGARPVVTSECRRVAGLEEDIFSEL